MSNVSLREKWILTESASIMGGTIRKMAEFGDIVKERWAELRRSVWSDENLVHLVQQTASLLGDEVRHDKVRAI